MKICRYHLSEEIETLSRQFLADDFHNFILLKLFTVNVQRKIVGVNHSLQEVEVPRDQIFDFIGNENSSDVQLEGGFGSVVVVVHAKWGGLGDVNDRLEFNFTLGFEVAVGQSFVARFGETLVEGLVFLFGNIFGRSSPDWLVLVELSTTK